MHLMQRSYWVDPETIDKIEHISGIEDYLRAALNDLDTQKVCTH